MVLDHFSTARFQNLDRVLRLIIGLAGIFILGCLMFDPGLDPRTTNIITCPGHFASPQRGVD